MLASIFTIKLTHFLEKSVIKKHKIFKKHKIHLKKKYCKIKMINNYNYLFLRASLSQLPREQCSHRVFFILFQFS